jgi:hypothetical protein
MFTANFNASTAYDNQATCSKFSPAGNFEDSNPELSCLKTNQQLHEYIVRNPDFTGLLFKSNIYIPVVNNQTTRDFKNLIVEFPEESKNYQSNIFEEICSRTPMKPLPLDQTFTKDRLCLFDIHKRSYQTVLSLSSDSKEVWDQMANQIEKNIS